MVFKCEKPAEERGKLDPNHLGPDIIVGISGKSVDLQDIQGVIKPKINIDNLVVNNEEHPRVPQQCKPSVTTTKSTTPVTNIRLPFQRPLKIDSP